MKVLGITGGIASGKSFIANIFNRDYGIPVFDADAVNRKLLAEEDVLEGIKNIFPDVFNNKVYGLLDIRTRFKKYIATNPLYLYRLEDFIIPFLEKRLQAFLEKHQDSRQELVIVDAPLLFEKNWSRYCDKVLVVSAHKWIRRWRYYRRTGTMEMFNFFFRKQLTDKEKFKYADYIISNNFAGNKTLHRHIEIILKEILELNFV